MTPPVLHTTHEPGLDRQRDGQLEEPSGSGWFHNFRTEIGVEGWGGSPFASIPSPRVYQQKIDHDDFPTVCLFEISARAYPDIAPVTSFTQVSGYGIKTPNLVSM